MADEPAELGGPSVDPQTGDESHSSRRMEPRPSDRSVAPAGRPSPLVAARSSRVGAIGLIAILVFSLAIRIVSLETIPPNVTADEGDNLQVAYRILVGSDAPGLFGLDWMGAPAFSVYLIAASLKVFGWSITSMRLASVFITTLALIPLYFVARERLSVKASLATCFLASTSVLYLHFSRSGWQNPHVALFALMAAWCLILALRRPQTTRGLLFFALAGVWCALAMYSYFPGRLIIVALLGYLPFALASGWRYGRRILAGYGLMLVVTIAVFAPQVPEIATNWDKFTSRTDAVAITSVTFPYRGAGTPLELAFVQVRDNVRGFILLDGRVADNSRYYPIGRPILDPVTGSLFLIGAVASLFRFRRYALWWCLFAIPLAFTQLFSMWTPDFGRAVPLIPFMCLFAGLGLDSIASRSGTWLRAVQLAAFVSLLWAASDNISTYIRWSATPQMAAARQPAVEVTEFDTWQRLLVDELSRGGGFNLYEWQEMRSQYFAPRPEVSAAVAAPPSAKPETPAAVPVDAPLAPSLLTPDPSFRAGLFTQPRGVAFGADGSLYVVDSGAREIVRLDASGAVMNRWGAEGLEDGTFLDPWDVCVDRSGRVYVLDTLQQSVQRFGPDGRFEARLLANEGLYRPRGLAIGADDNLYVADTGRNRVLRVALDGRVSAVFGAAETGVKLEQPTDVAVDATGAVWVVEPTAMRLQRLDAAGNRTGIWGYPASDTLNAPHLAIAGEWLVATDPARARILAYSLEGSRAVSWEPDRGAEARLGLPFALAADPNGAVVLSDAKNGSVVRYQLGGAD